MVRRKEIAQLAELLHKARLAKGLSARELADIVGVHHKTILYIEQGRFGQPKAFKLTRLARALDLDPTDLLTLAGYQVSDRLPGLGVYLRTATELPEAAIDELHGYFDYLHTKYGVEAEGPRDGEDEADDGPDRHEVKDIDATTPTAA